MAEPPIPSIRRRSLDMYISFITRSTITAYAVIVDRVMKEIYMSRERLLILGIGGSAIGTGVNTHPLYQKKIIMHLRKLTGIKVAGSKNLIASMQSMGDFVCLSGNLRLLAVELIKIANDLRILHSGA